MGQAAYRRNLASPSISATSQACVCDMKSTECTLAQELTYMTGNKVKGNITKAHIHICI